eukprot:m.454291 g.454291  ORF g.454291 m.454291 type:complete len:187 (+) comp21567_c0_seq3:1955-2515(+)
MESDHPIADQSTAVGTFIDTVQMLPVHININRFSLSLSVCVGSILTGFIMAFAEWQVWVAGGGQILLTYLVTRFFMWSRVRWPQWYVHASNNASLKLENSKSNHKNTRDSAEAPGSTADKGKNPTCKASRSRSPSRKSSSSGSADDVRECLLSPGQSTVSRSSSATPPVDAASTSVSVGGLVTSTV